MMNIIAKILRGGGKTLSYILSMIAMFGLVLKVSAEGDVVDLEGKSVSSADFGVYENKIIMNGELTLTASPSEATAGKYTIGSDAVVKYAGGPGFSGDWDFNIIDGGVFEQTKESDGRFLIPFYYGKASFILDKGTFKSVDDSRSNNAETLNFGVIWINNSGAKGKDISANVKIQNKSKIELTRGQLRIGGARASGDKKPKTLKVDFAVEDSSIYVAKEIKFGVSNSGWLQNADESYVKATFGKNSDITCKQFYADGNNPSPSVTFDGATFHWLEGGNSFIGHNKVGDIYTIAAGGLTVDIPKGKALTCDSNASSLKGEGGITKIGEGSITWNNVSSAGTAGMTFTGPLVVSNGTWTSTLSYAATAFAVDGANSTLALSGSLTATAPDMAATDGGTLNLRTEFVTTRTVGALTLGEGATLAITGGGLGVDSFSATSLDLIATAANPVKIEFDDAGNIASGTYNFITITGGGKFAAGDEAKFALDADAPEGSTLSVSGASLVLTVPATNPATWTGGANDGKFSSAGNWLGNKVPGEEDEVVISVPAETTLDCDVNLKVHSVAFPSTSAKVTIGGIGSIVCVATIKDNGATTNLATIANGSTARHIIGVQVEFVLAENYAPIDVTGAVDFQAGVTGTVPENHTTFYGNYTLTGTSWTLSSPITLAANATVTATAMEMHPNGKLLNAETGSKLKIKQITFDRDIRGNIFGVYNGELDVGTFYSYYPNGTITFNSGFAGLFRFGHFHGYTAGKTSNINFSPASSATIVAGGAGIESQTGWFKLGSLVIRSSGDWTIKLTKNNYTYSSVSQSVEINSGSFDIDTSDYGDSSAAGHTVTVVNKETKYAESADYLLKGAGAMSAFGIGTMQFQSSANFTGGFTASNGVTVAVNKNAYPGKGNVTIKDTATLKLAQSSSGTVPVAGTLTIEGGSRLLIPALARDVVPLSAAAVVFDISDDKKVALEIQNATEIGEGIYPILSSASEIPESALNAFAQEQELEGCALRLSSDRKMIMLVCGSVNYWVGDVSTDLTDAGNWLNGVPGEGESATIACGAETTLTIPEGKTFSPSSIVFSGGAPVTIEGPGIISGIVAVTNSSPVSHTINAPVHFVGNIAVAQNARGYATRNESHITFAGGAYAAEGCSIALWRDGYSYAVFGRYVLANTEESPYAITEYKVSSTDDIRFYVAPGSALEVPYAGAFTELDLAEGGVVTNRVVSMPEGQRLSHKNYGEYVIADEFTVSGSNKKDGYAGYNAGTGAANVFKIEKATCNKTDGYTFYFAEANGASHGTYYFGEGGINFGDGKGYFGIGKNKDDDAQTIRPWYGDFTIETGIGNTDGFDIYFYRSVTFNTDDENGKGRTITLNARPKFNNTPTFTVSGTGKVLVNSVAKNEVQPPVTVTDTATLAFKPGASLTTDNITVNSGATLAVAGSGTFALGGDLTLKNGACLGFNYSTRNAPMLDLMDKNVTLGDNKNIVVKITSENGKRAFAGKNVLTSGGKFTGVNVTLAEGAPDWVKGIDIVDGEIVLDVKPIGTKIIVR